MFDGSKTSHKIHNVWPKYSSGDLLNGSYMLLENTCFPLHLMSWLLQPDQLEG
jgi:hypothetical protein